MLVLLPEIEMIPYRKPLGGYSKSSNGFEV